MSAWDIKWIFGRKQLSKRYEYTTNKPGVSFIGDENDWEVGDKVDDERKPLVLNEKEMDPNAFVYPYQDISKEW